MPDSSASEEILDLLAPPEIAPGPPVERLRDLSANQWKSGIAAWLGWLFDGLDMHLYTLVATPFVAELLNTTNLKDPQVGKYSSIIQAAFLVGWALGGGFFGRVGDRLGRSRALVLTILTYACFTGLSFFAQTWWHLLIFRFLAALGIGGEWSVGAALLSETWPTRWRPWIAATLQSAVNCGVLLAALTNVLLASAPPRYVFLVGLLPALLVLWVRKAVPEPEQWAKAKEEAGADQPGVMDLFRGSVRRVTVLTVLVCSLSLTGHWAFLFWCFQHMRTLPDVQGWSDSQLNHLVATAMVVLMVSAIIGNYLAGFVARWLGYRRSIALFFFVYFLSVTAMYGVERELRVLWYWLPIMGMAQGAFGLFTMYLPPLFPTLLRTTGAGFCYNIGRIAAALGTVFFNLISKVGDIRIAIFFAGFLMLPAALIALLMPEPPADRSIISPVE